MRRLSLALALGAATCLSLPAAYAQDTAAPTPASGVDSDEADEALRRQIIVEGERRLAPKEIGQALDQLTRRTGLFEPVARFEAPICVMVVGLGQQIDEAIAARIRENVLAVGLRFDDRANCRANAITIITHDPQVTFATLRNKRPWLIGWPQLHEYSPSTLKAQLAAKTPTVSWSTFDAWLPDNRALLAGQPQAGGFWGWNSGRMPTFGGRRRGTAMVLVDAKHLNGIRIHQLVDFLTVHLLGSSRSAINASEAGVPTILSLFDGDPKRAPQRLTTFDRAYLCGLHHIRTRGTNMTVNLAINTRMKQNMLDVYDSECVRVGAPADEPAGDALPAPQPQPGLDTATKP